ncbi:MAG: hypothetical protein CL678_18475 [Bdellovibrionaceae bacterium]|nr:hypothetical protein [Pseudobdellovibrionaceae bacterium]|tara:strand:- start:2273 stop:3241 length:969 start_codon:yes stop_codon:yes gene_type:complete
MKDVESLMFESLFSENYFSDLDFFQNNKKQLNYYLKIHQVEYLWSTLSYTVDEEFESIRSLSRMKWAKQTALKLVVEELFLISEIDFEWIKGIQLAEEVYPDPLIRPMGDLDLLVSKKHWFKAIDVLVRTGFSRSETQWKNRLRLELSHPHWGLIDLHGELYPGHRGSFRMNYPISGLEDRLLYLFIHSCHQHALEKVIWINDFYYFLLKYQNQIDFDKFFLKVKENKLISSVYFVLSILKEQKGFIPSEEFENKIDKEVSFFKRNLLNFFKKDFFWMNSKFSGKIKRFFVRVILRDSIYDFFSYLINREKIKFLSFFYRVP